MAKMKNRKVGRKRSFVPFVRPFRPPTRKEAIEACANLDMRDELKPLTSFKQVPRCTSQDDWFAQYCEEGQSFTEFMSWCPWLSPRKCRGIKQEFIPSEKTLPQRYPNGSIYLLPIGEFSSHSSPDFQNLVEYSQIFFGIPVKTLPIADIIIKANSEVFCRSHGSTKEFWIKSRTKGEKYQLNIYTLLDFVRSVAPDDALATIALTMSDIYQATPDLFVAGMAAGLHRVAVFSFCRYNPNIQFSPEFWYEMNEKRTNYSKLEIRNLILVRSCRLLVHEIAHLLGLAHCIYYECCMNGSGHLEEDFRQPMFLCPVDIHKLFRLCGFDILQRYHDLKQFFKKFNLVKEVNWLDQRLEAIQKVRLNKIDPISKQQQPAVRSSNPLTKRKLDKNNTKTNGNLTIPLVAQTPVINNEKHCVDSSIKRIPKIKIRIGKNDCYKVVPI